MPKSPLRFVAAVVDAIDDDRQTGHRHIQIGEGQAEITDLHVARHLDVNARLLRVAAAVENGEAQRVLIVDQQSRIELAEHTVRYRRSSTRSEQ